MHECDIIVVGKGNAALCAALSAQEQGAKVLMLEAAPEAESGGNSRFAGGVMRFASAGFSATCRSRFRAAAQDWCSISMPRRRKRA